MEFLENTKQKVNGLWYPKSITVSKSVTIDEVARRLATGSTVSPADIHAVLKAIPVPLSIVAIKRGGDFLVMSEVVISAMRCDSAVC